MIFQAFSLTETNPFEWKDSFLFATQTSLQIIPNNTWYGKLIKNLTSNAVFSQSALSSIRDEFIRLRKEHLATTDPKKIFTANKNISYLNEKIHRYNQVRPESDHLAIVEKLPLPQLITQNANQGIKATEKRMEKLSLPTDGHAPNLEKANLWLRCQHASLQPLAFVFAQSVIQNYVDFPTFVASFDASVQLAFKSFGRRSFGVVTLNNAHLSNSIWAKSLLKIKRPPQAEMNIIKQGDTNAFSINYPHLKRKTKKPTIKEWLYVDDAVFFQDQIVQILASLKGKLTRLYPKENMRLHLAIPYVSSHVLKRLQMTKTAKADGNITIVLHSTHVVESVAEIAERELSKEDREAGLLLLDTLFHTQAYTTSFSHKRSEFSLPRDLLEGAVWMRSYKALTQNAIFNEPLSNISFMNKIPFIT